jgi:hypothetical protein
VKDQTNLAQTSSASRPGASGSWIAGGWLRLVGIGVGIILAMGLVALGLWLAPSVLQKPAAAADLSTPEVPTAEVPLALKRPVVSEAGLAEKAGVRIVYVALTGGGGLIDLRFQVIDPDKAPAVHDQAYPPTIVDENTGLVVNQLLMGHSHTEPFNGGETYYLIFENPGSIVQTGGKVSVLLGNMEVDDVIVK